MQALNRADHHTDMRRHFAAVKNGDASGGRHRHTLPVRVLLFVAGDEIRARFVAGDVMQLQAEHMPVIKTTSPQQSSCSKLQARLAQGLPLTSPISRSVSYGDQSGIVFRGVNDGVGQRQRISLAGGHGDVAGIG